MGAAVRRVPERGPDFNPDCRGRMISLKKLLENDEKAVKEESGARPEPPRTADREPESAQGMNGGAAQPAGALLSTALDAYRSALLEFGNCSIDA